LCNRKKTKNMDDPLGATKKNQKTRITAPYNGRKSENGGQPCRKTAKNQKTADNRAV
jgi:hypothetical protein